MRYTQSGIRELQNTLVSIRKEKKRRTSSSNLIASFIRFVLILRFQFHHMLRKKKGNTRKRWSLQHLVQCALQIVFRSVRRSHNENKCFPFSTRYKRKRRKRKLRTWNNTVGTSKKYIVRLHYNQRITNTVTYNGKPLKYNWQWAISPWHELPTGTRFSTIISIVI